MLNCLKKIFLQFVIIFKSLSFRKIISLGSLPIPPADILHCRSAHFQPGMLKLLQETEMICWNEGLFLRLLSLSSGLVQ
ncbi:hypothetical protein ES332_D13G038700v1 [Gossypium tomentosum]|uniref:Uncharacterized protein n=1 Tax=Gossypium tomentosum TaxID=34277 RepID=A0A5D2HT59_GOSTO|nr:hypothetical protein ES332_D13G038700v1 [Gossypium tomentosum]